MTSKLSPEQLQRYFEKDVRPYLENSRDAQDTGPSWPCFVSVGGQPGSGKSGAIRQARRENPGSVIVNGDELRQFHPDYPRLMATDPLSMPEVTAQAAGSWVGMSNQWLRDNRVSAVVETTLRQPAVLLREFEAFKQAGYGTELRVVAVPPEVSRLGTLARYVGQAQEFGVGRTVTAEGHDIPTAVVPGTVETLVASGLVDRVVVQDRDGRVFLDAEVSRDDPELAAKVREVVDRARDVTSMTSGQAQACFRAAAVTMEGLGAVRETDRDLHKVAARITGPDAQAIAARAWPRDAVEQQQALKELKSRHGSFIRAAALPDPQQALSRNPAVPERHPHRGKPGRSRGMER